MANLNSLINSGKKQEAANRPDPRARFAKNQKTLIHMLADFNPADNELEKKVLMSQIEPDDGVHVHMYWYQNGEGRWTKEEYICWKEIQGINARCPFCAGDHAPELRKIYKYFGTAIYMYNPNFEQFNDRGEQDMIYGWQRILFMPMFNSPYGQIAEYASNYGNTTNYDMIINIVQEVHGQKAQWVHKVTPTNFDEPFPVTDLQIYTPADMFKRLSEKLSFEATLNKKDESQANQQARQNFLTKRPAYKPVTPAATNGHSEQEQAATAVAVAERAEVPGLDDSMVAFMEQNSNRTPRKIANRVLSREEDPTTPSNPENEAPF